ncbi:FKBP12-interacting protein of 37 kDa isoform X3 [Hevea brasiliensis]|uniref:FKBP12-interacting protein of 37 kDa isoform X3 n=1 Tax=Hevea brasiliensis TaxID=3981 RepID=UPI0025EDB17A|nr:FKBP12-interacting protein of 37 kDa isoform X3 [Hevea brasiliensis]
MASHNHLDDDDVFGGDFPGSHNTVHSGNKRSFGDLEDDEDDIFSSKKGNTKVEETAMILSLRESLDNCKSALTTCQTELEAAKSEIEKWRSAFENESFIPAGAFPEPELVINYLQTLKSSEESLKEQLEKAKKKEAAFIVTFAKREQEIAELKSAVRDLKAQLKPPSMQARRLLLDPAIHEEFTRLKIHELAMKLALQKSQNAELRSQFEGLHKHVDGLINDVDKSNAMVLTLQEKLEEKDLELNRLKLELQQKGIEEGQTDSAHNVDSDEIVKPKQETDID